MRVVAGQWKGRRITAPQGRDTRPTADRVREAIFSAVVSRIGSLEGVQVLDLYAGSGALGIEALSRGAAGCTFVDSARSATSAIKRNLDELGADPKSALIQVAAVERYSPREGSVAVGLLLADPPYRIDAAKFAQVLQGFADRGALEHGALVVYEHSAETSATWPKGFEAAGERRYGDTAVSFSVYEG